MAEEGWEGKEEPTADLSILWFHSGQGFGNFVHHGYTTKGYGFCTPIGIWEILIFIFDHGVLSRVGGVHRGVRVDQGRHAAERS